MTVIIILCRVLKWVLHHSLVIYLTSLILYHFPLPLVDPAQIS
jgi:hypothetical protein